MSNPAPQQIRRRRVRGKLRPLPTEHQRERLERRKRRGTWAVRTWARRHIKGEN